MIEKENQLMLDELDSLLSMSYNNEQRRRKDFENFLSICKKLNLSYQIEESESKNSLYIYIFLNNEHLRKSNIIRDRAKQLTRGRNVNIPEYLSISTYEIDKYFELEKVDDISYPKYNALIAIAKYRFSDHDTREPERISSESGSLLYLDLTEDLGSNLTQIENELKQKIKEAERKSIDLCLEGF